MCIHDEKPAPNKLIVFGMLALAIANVGGYVIRRKLALPESVADPLSGFLIGLAIATMLLGVAQQARARRNRG